MAQNSYLGSGLLDDLPETNWPSLRGGLQELADSVAELAPFLPAGRPLLLSGEWGSGKTTLLLAMKNRLDENKVPVVWFDAWRYEREATLLASLIRAVWEQSTKPDKLKKTVFEPLWRSALTIGLQFAPEIASLAGFGFLKPLLKLLDPAALQKGLDAVPTLETMVPPDDEASELQKKFQTLLEEGWPNRPKEQKVVILVDDLDRCSPTGMVALLEGIRLLLVGTCDTPCSFVVALDKDVLAQAVAMHYAGISGFDGHRYLEKIFSIHLSVPLPGPQEVSSLVSQFLTTDPSGDQRDALASVLADPLFANPRLMKRCINRFRLVVKFEERAARASGSPSSLAPRNDRTLARWIAATERWATLRGLLLKREDQYWEKVAHSLRESGAPLPDQEMEVLLREPGIRPWLQREMLGRIPTVTEFREADQRLRRWGL